MRMSLSELDRFLKMSLNKRKNTLGGDENYKDFDVNWEKRCWQAKKIEDDNREIRIRIPLISKHDVDNWMHEAPALIPGPRPDVSSSDFPDMLTPRSILDIRENDETGELEYKISFREIPLAVWIGGVKELEVGEDVVGEVKEIDVEDDVIP